MELIRCPIEYFGRITDFYKDAIANSPVMKECTRWIYGLHPSDER
ncbi:MAG: hypothetical protein Q4B85_13850 [Lachnospiraceae bacterium]|nr:hypothetical protein [Lachnospiraceae bacterium]